MLTFSFITKFTFIAPSLFTHLVCRSQPKAFFISIQKTKPLPKYNTKIINNQPTGKSSQSEKVSQTTKSQGDRLLEKKVGDKADCINFSDITQVLHFCKNLLHYFTDSCNYNTFTLEFHLCQV
jgi:hypothetical protein